LEAKENNIFDLLVSGVAVYDARTDGQEPTLNAAIRDGRRTMCIAGLTALRCWSQVTTSEMNRLSSRLFIAP